jgi:hypothetical protein
MAMNNIIAEMRNSIKILENLIKSKGRDHEDRELENWRIYLKIVH